MDINKNSVLDKLAEIMDKLDDARFEIGAAMNAICGLQRAVKNAPESTPRGWFEIIRQYWGSEAHLDTPFADWLESRYEPPKLKKQ